MDLSKLAATDTVKIYLKHPLDGTEVMDDSKQPKQMFIEFKGPHTNEYKKAMRKIAVEFNAPVKNKKTDDLTEDQQVARLMAQEGNSFKLLAAMAVSCLIQLDGKYVDCNYESMLELLSNPAYPWIVKQCDEGMHNEAAFIQG